MVRKGAEQGDMERGTRQGEIMIGLESQETPQAKAEMKCRGFTWRRKVVESREQEAGQLQRQQLAER